MDDPVSQVKDLLLGKKSLIFEKNGFIIRILIRSENNRKDMRFLNSLVKYLGADEKKISEIEFNNQKVKILELGYEYSSKMDKAIEKFKFFYNNVIGD